MESETFERYEYAFTTLQNPFVMVIPSFVKNTEWWMLTFEEVSFVVNQAVGSGTTQIEGGFWMKSYQYQLVHNLVDTKSSLTLNSSGALTNTCALIRASNWKLVLDPGTTPGSSNVHYNHTTPISVKLPNPTPLQQITLTLTNWANAPVTITTTDSSAGTIPGGVITTPIFVRARLEKVKPKYTTTN